MSFEEIVKARSSEREKYIRSYALGNNHPALARPVPREESRGGLALVPIGAVALSQGLFQNTAAMESDELAFTDILKMLSGEVVPSTLPGANMGGGVSGITPHTGDVASGSSASMIAALIRSDKFSAQGIAMGDLVYTATTEPNYIDYKVVAGLYTIVFTWGYSIWISTLRKGHNYKTSGGNISQHTRGSAVDIHKMNGVDMQTVKSFDPSSPPCSLAVDMISKYSGDLVPNQVIWSPNWGSKPVEHVKASGGTVNVPSPIPLGGHHDHIHAAWPSDGRDPIPDSKANSVPSMTREQALEAISSISTNAQVSTDVPKTSRIGVAIHYIGAGSVDQSAKEIDDYHRSVYEANKRAGVSDSSNTFNPRGNFPLRHIRYNGVIRKSGAWEDGRDLGVAGCHVASSPGKYLGNNTDYLGICITMMTDTIGPNEAQIRTLIDKITSWKFAAGFTNISLGNIRGHRDVPNQSTHCPGDAIYKTFGGSLDGLREQLRNTAKRLGHNW